MMTNLSIRTMNHKNQSRNLRNRNLCYTESFFFHVPQFIGTTVYWGEGFSKIGLDFPEKIYSRKSFKNSKLDHIKKFSSGEY